LIGKAHKQAIFSLVERKSGNAALAKVKNKATDLVSIAIINALKPLSKKVRTLTHDNGKEFAELASIDQAFESISYFAYPYSNWQRGSNENLNGLIRQYIPKFRPLTRVSHAEPTKIESLPNNRPRKRLGLKIPHDVFTQSKNRVAFCANLSNLLKKY
jgi:transposase, IS30 family